MPDPAERLLRAFAFRAVEQFHSARTGLSGNWWWEVEKDLFPEVFVSDSPRVMEERVLRSPEPVAQFFASAAREKELPPTSEVRTARWEERRFGKPRPVPISIEAWKFARGAAVTQKELSSDSRNEPMGHADALVTYDGRLFCSFALAVREGGGLNEIAVREMAQMLFWQDQSL